jgi:N-acyl homoserine lactone hydrolase
VTARRMWALDGARLYLATADLVTGGEGVQEIPAPTFLIEHAQGLVLLDTGLDPAASGREDEFYGELKPLVLARFGPELGVDAQLAAIGKSPADVTHVVVSHSHFDHTGGLRFFPHAKILIHEAEWQYVQGDPGPAVRKAAFDAVADADWQRLSGDHDVFGDGAVTLLSLPGHTPGNYALLVRLPSQTVLLTADTTHLRRAYEAELPMPIDTDHSAAVEAIGALKRIAARESARVWICHEPADWAGWAAPSVYR